MITHCVGVDFETDGVLNSLKEGFGGISEVQDGEDGATANKGALLGVSDVHNSELVLGVHLELGVHIVPLGGRWEVDLDFGGAAEDSVLNARVTDLGGNKDVLTEHELVVQVEGHLVTRELVPHGADNGKTSVGGLEEGVVEVVALSISLLDGSEGSSLNAGALEPWLAHLEASL
jgi:hypothetical protein